MFGLDNATGRAPTLAEKVARIDDTAELDGMARQLVADRRYTPEARAIVATRRAEIEKERRNG